MKISTKKYQFVVWRMGSTLEEIKTVTR